MSTCPCCGQPMPDDAALVGAIVGKLHFGLTSRRFLARLAEDYGRFVSRAAVIDAMYGDRPDGGPLTADKVIDLICWRARPKLAPYGLNVEADGSGGRRLIRKGAAA